jgi:hypothetical protein
MNRRIDERVALDPTDFGGKPEERELAVRLHQTKEDIPKSGIIIDATAPLARVVDEILRLNDANEPQSLIKGGRLMAAFDWHSGEITPATPITKSYRSTQKVRRFFRAECGEDFKFDRSFMAWMKAAVGQTMGDAVAEWRRRRAKKC